jgi:hypothetical protein
MLVGTLSLRDLFERNVHHVVPLYQRPYVWSRDLQWEPLWDDLRRLAESLLRHEPVRAHFMGAIVHEKDAVPPGQIETRLVIDGQQRLTTLQLLLKAFQDVVQARGIESFAQALGGLTHNSHPLISRSEQRFKVWPTNADRQEFRRVMEAGTPAALKEACGTKLSAAKVGRPLPDAYLYFAGVIASWLDADGVEVEPRVHALYSALYQQLRLVVIDLDDKDDAQLIFETLNARGTPLLAADLVKNALLQDIRAKGGAVDDLYERHWQPFDTDAAYWRKLIGRGHAQRPRIDVFLQHLLTLKTQAEVPAAHLYAAYRDFVRDRPDVAGTPEARLASIQRYARIYRRFDDTAQQPRISLFFERLGIMEIGTAYPFLLELISSLGAEEGRIVAVLGDIESLLVRRMVCRLSTRGYNRLFLDLVSTLHNASTDLEGALRAKLLSATAEYDRWPDDAEFMSAWTRNPLYENLTRPRLRLLLEALEAALRSEFAETSNVPRWLTVEHILPQSWSTHWPLPEGPSPVEVQLDRQSALHTIGNLTLLNDKLNPLVSNGPWAEKREALAEHSVLKLNRDLCDREGWDEAAIRERSSRLFDLALQCWPRPSASTIAQAEAA